MTPKAVQKLVDDTHVSDTALRQTLDQIDSVEEMLSKMLLEIDSEAEPDDMVPAILRAAQAMTHSARTNAEELLRANTDIRRLAKAIEGSTR